MVIWFMCFVEMQLMPEDTAGGRESRLQDSCSIRREQYKNLKSQLS